MLLHYPGERERWFSYRADLLHAFINEWLVENGIETGTTSPWGDVTPPPEPDQPLTRPAQRAISPAEVLKLSFDRAKAVRAELVRQGIPKERMRCRGLAISIVSNSVEHHCLGRSRLG